MGDGPQNALTGHIGSFEPNVLIAGLEGAAVLWLTIPALRLPVPGQWNWVFTIYGVFALLGVLLLGLAVEGLAGILEYLVTRRLWGKARGKVWGWYANATLMPASWGPGQRWMWESSQASQEFARRRLRLLTCRNTAFLLLLCTIRLAVSPVHLFGFLPDLVGGVASTALFVFLWLNAHRGWNRAVADADSIGRPSGSAS